MVLPGKKNEPGTEGDCPDSFRKKTPTYFKPMEPWQDSILAVEDSFLLGLCVYVQVPKGIWRFV